MTARDFVIAGGGVIGCSIAWQLARRGARVIIIEPGTPGRGATWASAGMLSPLGEASGIEGPGSERWCAFRRLADASFEQWPVFADELCQASGIDVGLGTEGKLHVALAESELPELDALAAAGSRYGVERLTRAEARALEPALSDGVAGALLVRRDFLVDNRRLGEAAWRAAVAAGAEVHEARVSAVLRIPGGAAHGVALEDGTTVSAHAVVVAAGAWSGAIGGLPEPLPVRPVRGQMLSVRTSAMPDQLGRSVQTAECYLVPRRDLVLVGATVDEVGWAEGPTPAGMAKLANAAARAVPSLAALPLAECWAGFRPGTPDDRPILGADPDAPGLFYATGHFRNGILLAPVTAEVVAQSLLGESPAIDLDPFTVTRFRAGST